MLAHATLEEAVGRVVIPLKGGGSSALADSLRASPYLNHRDQYNLHGVLPTPEDLLVLTPFSGGEHAITLLPEESRRNGDEPSYAFYVNEHGSQRFFHPELGGELKGKVAYITATPSTSWSPDEIVFRMQIATQTAKDMGADRVYAVFSEYPFARQDRGANNYNRPDPATGDIHKDKQKHFGQTDYVTVIMRGLLANGCDGIVTLHHHSGHVAQAAQDSCLSLGKSNLLPFVYNISPSYLVARYLAKTDILTDDEKRNGGEGIVIISPDTGALGFARQILDLSGYTNAELAYIQKTRGRANAPDAINASLIPLEGYSGNYGGKVGIIFDDMIDTFGTVNSAITLLSQDIAMKRFIVYGTHGIFSGGAEARLRRQRRLSDVLVLDTRHGGLRDLGPGTKRKITIIKPGLYLAYALGCVEKGIDPNEAFAALYKENPGNLDQFIPKLKRFQEHEDRHLLR